MPSASALSDEAVVKEEDTESDAPSNDRPKTRGRTRKPASSRSIDVVQSITKEEREEEEENKIRIKQEDKVFNLSEDSRTRRLRPIEDEMKTRFGPDFWQPTARDEMQLTPVSRLFLSWFLGGSTQATITRPSKRLDTLNGVKLFAYLMRKWNPDAPALPAQPGLAFIGINHDQPIRLFVKRGKGWMYCGDYMFQDSARLDVEEWTKQPKTVRDTWVMQYFGKDWQSQSQRRKPKMQKQFAEYLIQREQDEPWESYEPKEEEINERIRTGECEKVTPDLLRNDFDSGIMTVPVRGLSLHSYDAEFQKILVKNSRSRAWADEQQKREKEKLKKAKLKNANPATIARWRVMGIDSDSEDELEASPQPTSKRSAKKKKRPRVDPESVTGSDSASDKPKSKHRRNSTVKGKQARRASVNILGRRRPTSSPDP